MSFRMSLPGLSVRIISLAFGALLIGIFGAGTTVAQGTTGSIVGTLQDASGAVLPGSTVTATMVETGLSRETKTDGRGNFVFSSMEPGTYTVRFLAEGFKTKQVDHLILTNGATLPCRQRERMAMLQDCLFAALASTTSTSR